MKKCRRHEIDNCLACFSERERVSNSALSDGLDAEAIDRAARALWDSETHHLLEKAGHPTGWDNIPRITRKRYRNKVRKAIKAIGI